MKLGIYANLQKPSVPAVAYELIQWLEANGIDYILDKALLEHIPPGKRKRKSASAGRVAKNCDVLITFGGDGTMLSAAHLVGGAGTPILGINTGRLGFMTEADTHELTGTMELLLSGKYSIEQRMTLRAEIQSGAQGSHRMYALNDIILDKGSYSRTITFAVRINGEYFHTYVADGVIISTPTGSTAYSLSAGGPILVPYLSAVVISPICPHSLSVRPIVIPSDSRIHIELISGSKGSSLFADGQFGAPFPTGTKARIVRGDYNVRLVQCRRKNFYETLRAKFNWGYRSDMDSELKKKDGRAR